MRSSNSATITSSGTSCPLAPGPPAHLGPFAPRRPEEVPRDEARPAEDCSQAETLGALSDSRRTEEDHGETPAPHRYMYLWRPRTLTRPFFMNPS